MYKFSVWRTGKPEYLQKNLLQQRRQPTYHYGIDAGSWIRATSVTAKCFYNSIILASLHHPCSTAPSLLPDSIPAPQHHPRSPAKSSLPSSIPAPQLHPCSTAPSYLSCSILAPLDHHCLPSPSCFPVYPRLLAPLGNHVRKQFLNLKFMAHQWSYTILSSFKMVNSLLEAKIATKIKA